MRVLVIGSGGREHTLAWKLNQSKQVETVFCAPGNAGTHVEVTNVPIKVDDLDGILKFVETEKIDLTVVGPEYPLTLGLVDLLKQNGHRVFGPEKNAARLEASKEFCKEIMIKAGVPTANYKTVHSKEELTLVCAEMKAPLVIKNDGLAAGKGVFVCLTEEQVSEAIQSIYELQKPEKIVVEEYLEGKEVSYTAACAGEIVVPFAAAHDYKRIFDGDQGPNTGGMGTVSPTPNLTAEQGQWVLENVMQPVVQTMNEAGNPFVGFLFAGLMISPSGKINVLEFNVRFGDPETESVLRRLDSDLFELLYTLSSEHPADAKQLQWSDLSASCVVIASEGYPESSSKGDVITGIDQAEEDRRIKVFHAGTAFEGNNLVTAGGRVLAVTALADSSEESLKAVYQAVSKIQFSGAQYRTDIGK
ncbi:MAG: phosphoribosylamine--glycine ligase [Bdellovibrionota bacterium]